jgi:hypothetical protein
MKLKQLGILLVLVAALGGAGVVVYRNQTASWQGGGEAGGKLLGDLPVNDVEQVALREGTNEVNLVKADGLWRVRERGGYPADFGRLSAFLLKARDLKMVQSERLGPSQLARLDLAPPGQGTNSGLAVEFKGPAGKVFKTLLVGKAHLRQSDRPSPYGAGDSSWLDGRYVRLADSATAAVISDPLEDVEPRPEAWLSKDFIRVEKAKSVAVEYRAATNSWKLTRESESGEWTLADAKAGETLDSSKLEGLTNPLSSPSFTDVMPGDRLGAAGTNPPVVLRITTFDPFDYTIRIARGTNETSLVTVAVAARIAAERAPVADEKPADKARLDKEFNDRKAKLEEKLKQEQAFGAWTFSMPNWELDPLLKERSQLLAEPKAEGKKEVGSQDEAVKP